MAEKKYAVGIYTENKPGSACKGDKVWFPMSKLEHLGSQQGFCVIATNLSADKAKKSSTAEASNFR